MPNLDLLSGLANSRYAGNSQATADLELQKQAQAVPTSGTPSIAQNLGGQISQLQGQTQLGKIQQKAQQLGQIGSTGVQAQGANLANQTQQLQTGSQGQQQAQVEKLAEVAQVDKQQLFNARQQFAKSQAGLQFSNTTQLTDYAALNAQNQQQFNEYSQEVDNAYQMKQTMLNTAFTKLKTELTYQQQLSNQIQDQIQSKAIQGNQIAQAEQIRQQALDQQVKLQAQLTQIQKSIYEARAKQANNQMMAGAIGTIVGGVIGATAGAVGGPVGAGAGGIAGAAIGGGIGNIVGAKS